jgi:predicted Zn-dependent peptidase
VRRCCGSVIKTCRSRPPPPRRQSANEPDPASEVMRMVMNRRHVLQGLAGSALVGPGASPARASAPPASVTLDNGFRAHFLVNDSQYIAAALILRSSAIRTADGLGHMLEHTSFVGAAGSYAAREIKRMHQNYLQESNAATGPGMIQWQAMFLPKYLEQALGLLALTSLDQKCDVETVRQEARVVLQELYLDRYDARSGHQKLVDAVLFGSRHPYGMDTSESEIATAKKPPDKLAAELREYAQKIRLPANMELFLVGGFDGLRAAAMVARHFGSYAFAQGPMLAVPQAPVTVAHRAFSAASPELRRPLSRIKIAWNTGVGVTHAEAKVVLALSEYLNAMLFNRLRERHGDAYAPVASYQPDECSGIFEINIPSTQASHRIERKVFDGIAALKTSIDASELERFRDRVELKRRKMAESNEAIVERLVQRAVEGGSIHDLNLEAVTPDGVLAAARRYLPSYEGAYVRLSLFGR